MDYFLSHFLNKPRRHIRRGHEAEAGNLHDDALLAGEAGHAAYRALELAGNDAHLVAAAVSYVG